mmetsp:Transcript_47619/g.137004  ORF Transcript_47619/g.137004 Transcript_47619/m.137004 type:complete len:202 (-) Transcript_47619:295-900(-)
MPKTCFSLEATDEAASSSSSSPTATSHASSLFAAVFGVVLGPSSNLKGMSPGFSTNGAMGCDLLCRRCPVAPGIAREAGCKHDSDEECPTSQASFRHFSSSPGAPPLGCEPQPGAGLPSSRCAASWNNNALHSSQWSEHSIKLRLTCSSKVSCADTKLRSMSLMRSRASATKCADELASPTSLSARSQTPSMSVGRSRSRA